VYPESLCPNLSELILGFEPWFELEVLQSAASDFARTVRQWTRNLRANLQAAVDLIGPERAKQYRQYLIASDVQFRLGVITNYRVVLHRRAVPRR
jgi:cyclopropane fatty-acyl-phospholipid synthase-like methyltransferase